MSPAKTTLPKGVKATSGGTFDRDEGYKYFIASNPANLIQAAYPSVLVAVNELDTKGNRERLEELLDSGCRVMLDSGIFNLAMEHVRAHGVTHDEALSLAPEEIDGFEKLWDLYGEIATTYVDRLWGVVELDQGGVQNKPATRARIEKEFGIVPIPVYHPLLDGSEYYDTLAQGYDRMCMGNIVQGSRPLRDRLAHLAYEGGRRYPYLWTHLLGLTPNTTSLHLPMRGSSDSSSWTTPYRWMPSWRAFTMLGPAGGYPRQMWGAGQAPSEDGVNATVSGRRLTSVRMAAMCVRGTQEILNDWTSEREVL